MTLTCLYLGCWGPTKRQGAKDVDAALAPNDPRQLLSAEVVAPLLCRKSSPRLHVGAGKRAVVRASYYHEYYFWLFGFVAKLPLSTSEEIPLSEAVPTGPLIDHPMIQPTIEAY